MTFEELQICLEAVSEKLSQISILAFARGSEASKRTEIIRSAFFRTQRTLIQEIEKCGQMSFFEKKDD